MISILNYCANEIVVTVSFPSRLSSSPDPGATVTARPIRNTFWTNVRK